LTSDARRIDFLFRQFQFFSLDARFRTDIREFKVRVDVSSMSDMATVAVHVHS
jgi:hypothetical protein